MDETFRAVAESNGGYLHRADLLQLGATDRSISSALNTGDLRRIRVGTYVPRMTFDALEPEERHVVLARSVLDKFPLGSVALSHTSAAVMHGLAVHDADLATVHLTRIDSGAGRIESGIIHHEGRLTDGELNDVDGRLVVSPLRAVWESACMTSMRGALVVMDSGLHQRRVTSDGLDDVAGRFRAWRGARGARLVARFADGGAENAGESLYRYVCFEGRLPRPETQVPIVDHDGAIIAYSDVGWRELRHLGEFDGLRKYWRDLRPGEDASAAVVREKRREDRIRAIGFGMSRSTWADVQVHSARATADRLRQEIEQSHRLFAAGRRYIA